MIKEAALTAISKAMNQYLQLDPRSPTRLQPLRGKAICINITPPGVKFFVYIHEDSIEVTASEPPHLDCQLIGGPISFAQMNFAPDTAMGQLLRGNVRIEGDIDVALAFQHLLQDLDIDWQGLMAQFTGDAVAHQASQFFRGLRQWGDESAHSMQENITEYLQEEVRQVPPREEVNDFFADIDALTLQVDRLSARVEKLQR